MGNKSSLTQKLILLLILSLLVPPTAGAAFDLSELKAQERQIDWRTDSLQDNMAEEEAELSEIVDEVAWVESNIEKIAAELGANEQRLAELSRVLLENERDSSSLKQSLAILVRDLAEDERTSLLAKMLQHDSLSQALMVSDQRNALTDGINAKYQALVKHSETIAAARDQLELTKLALSGSRISLDLQRQALRVVEASQRQTVGATKVQLEAIAEERSQIQRQIFAAAFDNTDQVINLAEATKFARLAAERLQKETGQEISVPFLLALVKHESNFGNFLGKGHYKTAMCSDSQIEAFVYITQSLGLDPELMPVSKPAQYQTCGGAMGYAQFLPRTWLAYADKVARLTGHNPPSPWNAEDAFMAVALKLSADGATQGKTPAQKRRHQWESAMTYFSGSNWRTQKGLLPKIRGYADRILDTAGAYAVIIEENKN